MSRKRRWTKGEILTLWEMAGVRPVGSIAKRLGRTVSSVVSKARREDIKLFQGTYTVQKVCEQLGCDRSTVWRICKRLGLRVKRRRAEGGRGYGMLSEEQVWDISEAYESSLEAMEAWSTSQPHCVICHRDDRRHAAKGLCVRCYLRDQVIRDETQPWHIRTRALVNQVMDGMDSGGWKYGLLEFLPNGVRGVMETEKHGWKAEIEIEDQEDEESEEDGEDPQRPDMSGVRISRPVH